MALDTAQKRAAVPGVARPWMRSISPDVGKGREWRASAGLSYPVANFQAPAGPTAARLLLINPPGLDGGLGTGLTL